MAIPRRTSAFTLVEVLLAVALLALLLTAIAAAIHASFRSYDENDKLASVTQTARSILDRMTREIRTANDIDPNSTATRLGIQPPLEGTLTRIEYELNSGTLYYRRTEGTLTTTSVLLGGTDEIKVTAFDVVRESGLDWQGLACTKVVRVRLGLLVQNQALSMTASASPRRNQLY